MKNARDKDTVSKYVLFYDIMNKMEEYKVALTPALETLSSKSWL